VFGIWCLVLRIWCLAADPITNCKIQRSPSNLRVLEVVGWVELTESCVGFRCTQSNLHFAGSNVNSETQQQPVSELNTKKNLIRSDMLSLYQFCLFFGLSASGLADT
jgi:hypothetical protein